jgi:hypothetical protein
MFDGIISDRIQKVPVILTRSIGRAGILRRLRHLNFKDYQQVLILVWLLDRQSLAALPQIDPFESTDPKVTVIQADIVQLSAFVSRLFGGDIAKDSVESVDQVTINARSP